MGTLGTLAVSIIGDPKQLEKTFDGVTKKAEKLGKDMQKMGKNVTNVGKGMTKWVTGPIVAVGAGMLALAAKTGEYADRILDLSEITGLSTDAIQEWQHVAKIAGVETEAVTKATEGLVRRLPQLEAEGGRVTEQLAKLGLEFADLKEMSPDEMMDTLITRLAAMDDPLERNAIGAQLFGGAWKDIAPILGMGADEIERARKEAHELGTVMGEDALNDANNFRIEMEKLKTEFGALGRGLAMDVIPVLMDLLPVIRDSIIPAIRSFAEFIGSIMQAYAKLDPHLQRWILAGIGLVAALGPVLVVVGKIITAIGVITPIIAKVGAVIAGVAAGPITLIVLAIVAAIAIWVKWGGQIKQFISIATRDIRNFVTRVKQIFSGITDAILGPFRRAQEGLQGITSGIRTAINRINPLARQSPSLVEQVARGTQKMLDEYKRLETDLDIAPLAHTISRVDQGTVHVGGRVEVHLSGDGAQHLNESAIADAVTAKLARVIGDGNRRFAARTSLSPLSR